VRFQKESPKHERFGSRNTDRLSLSPGNAPLEQCCVCPFYIYN